MDILRYIDRKFQQLLGRDLAGRTDRSYKPPEATVRFCPFGHAVFEGNKLCNYGHPPS